MPSTDEAGASPVEAWAGSVEQLQNAAATGRPVMIPGTLERRPRPQTVNESASPRNPQSTPVDPERAATPEYEHRVAAPPAVSTAPFDRIASMMLQLTEWFIRRLRTT